MEVQRTMSGRSLVVYDVLGNSIAVSWKICYDVPSNFSDG